MAGTTPIKEKPAMHITTILLTVAVLAVVGLFVKAIVGDADIRAWAHNIAHPFQAVDFMSEVGAVTLAEAALLSDDDLQRGVIELFVENGVVMDRLPFMDIEGNSYAYNTEGALPGVAFRGVNEAYVESTGTVNQESERLTILGGDADVDRFIQQTRGNLNDQRAVQTGMKVKAAVMTFEDAVFNGDVAIQPKGFDGLRKRLVGSQVIDAAGAGPVAAGHDFFDLLDAAMAAVRGDVDAIYGPKAILSKIWSSARRLGGADFLNEELTGKRIKTYNGVPLLSPGQRVNGTDILGIDETVGANANVAGSLYFVSYGEDESDGGVTGLTNGGVMVDDLGLIDEKPAYRTRVELYGGVAVFGGKAASRLRGVRVS